MCAYVCVCVFVHVLRVCVVYFLSLTDTIFHSLGQFKRRMKQEWKQNWRWQCTKYTKNMTIKERQQQKRKKNNEENCEMWFMDRFAPKSFTVIGFDFVKMRYIILCRSIVRSFVQPTNTRRNSSQASRSARNKREYIITQKKKEYQIIKSSFCSLKLLHKEISRAMPTLPTLQLFRHGIPQSSPDGISFYSEHNINWAMKKAKRWNVHRKLL